MDSVTSTHQPESFATARRRPVVAYFVLGGATALALGSLLPWATVTAPLFGTVTQNGLEGGGLFTLVLAGVTALVAARSTKTELSTRRSVAVLVLASLALLVTVAKFASLSSDASQSQYVAVRPGFGLYLRTVAAGVVIGGAIRALKTSQRWEAR